MSNNCLECNYEKKHKGTLLLSSHETILKGGDYGETDELRHEIIVNRRHIRDLHATILHLMGLNHEKLTYHYGGLDQRLTGVVPASPILPLIS